MAEHFVYERIEGAPLGRRTRLEPLVKLIIKAGN